MSEGKYNLIISWQTTDGRGASLAASRTPTWAPSPDLGWGSGAGLGASGCLQALRLLARATRWVVGSSSDSADTRR